MALQRKYIPLATRLKVAERQFSDRGRGCEVYRLFAKPPTTIKRRLTWLLFQLGFEKPQLDHDPALELRMRRTVFEDGKWVTKYSPDELNPRFLIYRESAAGKNDHGRKTYGRAPDAEKTVTTKGSDTWLAKKFRRLAHPKKRTAKIPARKNPWPKRKIGK